MKTQTFILLMAFVLFGNVLAAQGKYEYASIVSSEGDSIKYNWVKIVGRDDERKMDKLEVQQIDKTQFTNGTQGLIQKFERGGWELFNHKEPMLYFRRLKK
jgi:hypothetical protein